MVPQQKLCILPFQSIPPSHGVLQNGKRTASGSHGKSQHKSPKNNPEETKKEEQKRKQEIIRRQNKTRKPKCWSSILGPKTKTFQRRCQDKSKETKIINKNKARKITRNQNQKENNQRFGTLWGAQKPEPLAESRSEICGSYLLYVLLCVFCFSPPAR